MQRTVIRTSYTFFIFLLSLHLSYAQLGKEAWHWQFGLNAAMDFSSGTPVTGTSAIWVDGGSASISDPNTGQLLFYTDGMQVWDKNNNQMPNGFGMMSGLPGTNQNATQAALIVPKPGSPAIYYVISADQGGEISYPNFPNRGVHYSIVDMGLNGGLGDVTTKNILLTPPPTTEKLTAIRHCNGNDYWIIDHPFNSNTFNAYLLTSSGLSLNPVASNVGTVQSNLSGKYYETSGYMKASPNGKKLACAFDVLSMNFIELFDFDNATGIVSNAIKIPYILPYYIQDGVYSVAFSPDNSKLYATDWLVGLWQYDLSSNNASTITNSQTTIYGYYPCYLEAAQLGPDGKIYISMSDNKLSVINNPNALGLACNFQLNAITLPAGATAESGLPNFIDANNPFASNPYPSQSYYVPLCSFPSYTLTANGNSTYQWSNGDTTQSINIDTFGVYGVSYINAQGCIEKDTFHITQNHPLPINILHDTSQCNNQLSPINVNATYANVHAYLWSDGFTSPIHAITNEGSYWVDYTFTDLCISRDSFSYTINNAPHINLGEDTILCLGNTLLLNASNPSSTYGWSTGQTTPLITINTPNTYWVKVTNQYNCVSTDSLIVFPETRLFDIIIPNIVTPNNDGINDFIDFSKYRFSELQLYIYNRWGAKVFESTDPTCVWKPTEEDGTYYYVAQYVISCGIERQQKAVKGFISVMR